MPSVRSQPLLVVRDVQRSSKWYQSVLGAKSGHGGDEYEQIVIDDQRVLILQLHAADEDHHHGPMYDSKLARGNGVAVWFELDDLESAIARARKLGAEVVTDLHSNPNAGHRELWLRDPDGYLVVIAGR